MGSFRAGPGLMTSLKNYVLVEELFGRATGDSPDAVSAAIFWTKLRAECDIEDDGDGGAGPGSMEDSVSDVVKPFTESDAGDIMAYVDSMVDDADVIAVAIAAIRSDGRVIMKAYVNPAQRSELRGVVLALGAELAEGGA